MGAMKTLIHWCVAALALFSPISQDVLAAPASAPAPEQQVRQLWQLLDYVAVDYGGAVQSGTVVRDSEYQEMREFSDNALTQSKALPEHPSREQLVALATELRASVSNKASAERVADIAHEASQLLLAAYPIPVAPRSVPDLQQGRSLYQAQCAACHGATGAGDGQLANKLDPKPIAFTNAERARSRSLMALYQVISQGVNGTSMPAFSTLSEADRWALAFYVGTLSYRDGADERGAAAFAKEPGVRAAIPDMKALVTLTEAELSKKLPPEIAHDALAHARGTPEVLVTGSSGISLARKQLQASLAALGSGDRANATRLALSAYLDGFEPLEAALDARNKQLLVDVERTMQLYRAAVSEGRVDQAKERARDLDELFGRVESELGAGRADAATTFVGALTILLREGVEALLIIVAMVAFLRKAQRPQALRYVHAGWVAALLGGALTWVIATHVVSVSGASREVTEGVSSLFAAVVLLSVGLWMHQKSTAGRWQAYLRDRLSTAMTKRSAWALFALAFIAVYREVFETVLFFSALAADGHGSALMGGLVAGMALLGIIAAVFLRTSARLPIGKFFALSSILVAVLAVVLAGKGVAGMQEAGWLAATPIAWLRSPGLGVYPTLETNLAQLIVLIVAVAGFSINAWQARRLSPA